MSFFLRSSLCIRAHARTLIVLLAELPLRQCVTNSAVGFHDQAPELMPNIVSAPHSSPLVAGGAP